MIYEKIKSLRIKDSATEANNSLIFEFTNTIIFI